MKTKISFVKMQALGNDFMVVDNRQGDLSAITSQVAQLSHRTLGIGFDQLLMIEKSTSADFFCRIYNADGSEAEQCGNGLRCVAWYIHETQSPSPLITIATKAGIFPIEIKSAENIRLKMGIPHYTLLEKMVVVSLGNPHAIVEVDEVDKVLLPEQGISIANNKEIFPHGANVGFMQIMNPHHIRLRTLERGSGETYACGSNACATAVAAMIKGRAQSSVTIHYRYGNLMIDWEGEGKPIYLNGPASFVYRGEIILNNGD